MYNDFDRRMLGSNPARCKAGLISRFLLPEMEGKKRRITAVDYRPDGQEILVSFSSDYIHIFDPKVFKLHVIKGIILCHSY